MGFVSAGSQYQQSWELVSSCRQTRSRFLKKNLKKHHTNCNAIIELEIFKNTTNSSAAMSQDYMMCRNNIKEAWQTLVAIMLGKKVDIGGGQMKQSCSLFSSALKQHLLFHFSIAKRCTDRRRTDAVLIGTVQPSVNTLRTYLSDSETGLLCRIYLLHQTS